MASCLKNSASEAILVSRVLSLSIVRKNCSFEQLKMPNNSRLIGRASSVSHWHLVCVIGSAGSMMNSLAVKHCEVLFAYTVKRAVHTVETRSIFQQSVPLHHQRPKQVHSC